MITPTQAQAVPVVGWEAEPGAFYTLVLTDPDAPSRASPTLREWVHWVRVNIPGDNLPCDGEDGGDDLKTYVGAGPPASTGLHRYVFLLYKQPNGKQSFEEADRTPFVKNGRDKWSAAKFAEVPLQGTACWLVGTLKQPANTRARTWHPSGGFALSIDPSPHPPSSALLNSLLPWPLRRCEPKA